MNWLNSRVMPLVCLLGILIPMIRAQGAGLAPDAQRQAVSVTITQWRPQLLPETILYLLSPGNGQIDTTVVPIERGAHSFSTKWSSDGTRLAFERYPPANEETIPITTLCCLDTGSGDIRELGKLVYMHSPLFAWLPDSHDIVMVSPAARNTIEIVRVQADNPARRTVLATLPTKENPGQFALAPNGKYFAVMPDPTAVYVAEIDGKNLQRYAFPENYPPRPVPYWSDDSKFLLITTCKTPVTWQAATRQFATLNLDGDIRGWLPKSTEIVCTARDGKRLQVLDVETGKQTVLAVSAGKPIIHIAMSPNGKTLACMLQHPFLDLPPGRVDDLDHTADIALVQRRQPTTDMKVLERTEELCANFRWSPDGEWLATAWSSREGDSVALYTAEGERKYLLPEKASEYWWAPDSRRLIVLQRNKQLVLHGIDGEQIILLMEIADRMAVSEVGMGFFPAGK